MIWWLLPSLGEKCSIERDKQHDAAAAAATTQENKTVKLIICLTVVNKMNKK